MLQAADVTAELVKVGEFSCEYDLMNAFVK